MLDLFKKEKCMTAIANGSILDISLVPDQVFSKKILGDGFAIIPSDGNFVSPVAGTIADVTETRHAYCITSDDGLDVLVHIGIDTVELRGNGFKSLVNVGDKVEKGTPIAKVDLALVEKEGYNTTSMVVVTNPDKLRSLKVFENPTVKIGDKAMIYKL
ncbi:MAG: PTS glucose transporter subunit IIA [Clostridia bacterium]|nr:PTS glucose transporter subunit IIA [Clostridia bacterium]